MEMEGVVLDLVWGGDVVDKWRLNDGRQTKPHPQPLSEERGEWLVVKMEEAVLGLFRDGDVVANKA